MKRAWRMLALVAGVAGVPATAEANPVNAEDLGAGTETPGWNASLDTKVSLQAGNVDRLDVGFGGGLQHRRFFPKEALEGRSVAAGAPPFLKRRWLLTTDIALARVGENAITDRGFMHARYTRMVIPRVGGEVFVQSQYNAFTLLRTRSLLGTGLRIEAIHRRLFRLWGGSGYMAEYEVLAVEPSNAHPAELLNHRWTSYVALEWLLLKEQLVVRNTLYVQPRFDAFDDVRFLNGSSVEARIGSVFAMGVDLDLQYDSRPPKAVFQGEGQPRRDIEELDLKLVSYLRFRLGS